MEAETKTKSSPKEKKQRNCCSSFCKWIGSPSFFIYLEFFMSQWGDWMWQFAVGLYLVHLSHHELLLAAIFGFSGGGCVLLFGGIIGDWVDRNGRLKVVRVSLFIQNMSVMLSAICVCVVLALEPTVASLKYGEVGRRLMEMAIIILAISAQLANVAYTIAIEKDWIIIIAQEKSSNLANLNAGTRTLGLMCKILSPTAVGFIMTYSSLLTSAIVIAGWNLVSVFIEYAILLHIYQMVPRLAVKKNEIPDREKEMQVILPETEPFNQSKTMDEISEKLQTDHVSENGTKDLDESAKTPATDEKADEEEEKPPTDSDPGCIRKVLEPFSVLVHGWHTYARQTVVYAGISLAFLYMTVLGFDSITIGYIYANKVSEVLVGVCMALAGLTGICGTLLFPFLRKRLGLETTGLIAFSAEIGCLVLAVISIWAPGSCFNPYFASSSNATAANSSTSNSLSDDQTFAVTVSNHFQNTSESGTSENSSPAPNVSIILLLVGIISSRVGLWMADLVVTQLMQETVLEKERGIVHGVQNSLNMFMDMLKFVLVIVAPQIQIFGFHIIISFSFICAAGLFFVRHVMRVKRRKRLAAKVGSGSGLTTEANV